MQARGYGMTQRLLLMRPDSPLTHITRPAVSNQENAAAACYSGCLFFLQLVVLTGNMLPLLFSSTAQLNSLRAVMT